MRLRCPRYDAAPGRRRTVSWLPRPRLAKERLSAAGGDEMPMFQSPLGLERYTLRLHLAFSIAWFREGLVTTRAIALSDDLAIQLFSPVTIPTRHDSRLA